MRMDDAEIGIIKKIRGLKKGQMLINKNETGQVDVEIRYRDQLPSRPVKPSEGGDGRGRISRLRG